MAEDLFRLIQVRNRLAFSIEGREGKAYRTRLIAKTREIEADLRNVLASNYLSTIGGPNYTIALRAYAIEFARIRLALEDLHLDTYYESEPYCSPRADIFYQKVAALMGVDKDLQLTIFSTQEFCQFIQALISIFFGGSTPANIARGIELFVGEEGVVTIHENFLDARDPTSPYDISDQFGFRVDFELTEEISRNFSDIGVKLDFLLDLIKPAHTLYVLRFLFSDISPVPGDADDTFHVDHIWDHAYDDARKYCSGVEGRDRLGVNVIKTVTEDLTGIGGTVIEVTYGPISKDLDVPSIGGVGDVQVLVDGVPALIVSVDGAAGIITVANPILPTETVLVTYKYWTNTRYGMLLNQPGRVLPGRDQKYPTVWYVLNSVQPIHPLLVTWTYGAYENDYTAGLNNPALLLLNEPPHQISDPDTGRIYGHRHVLNWANYVLSPDQVSARGFKHELNEDTPPVEFKETYAPEFEWETEFEVPDDEGWGVCAWGSNPLGWGSPYIPESAEIDYPQWVITDPGGIFLDPLDYSTTEEGEAGLLTIACDGGLQSIDIVTPFEDEYEFPEPPYCDNAGLFIFNQSVVNGTDLLNNFNGVEGCELWVSMGTEAPFEDTSPVPSTATDDPMDDVVIEASDYRSSGWDTSGMFTFNVSDLNGPDVLWNNEAVGHWNDEGHITVILGAWTYHLPSNSNTLAPGPP